MPVVILCIYRTFHRARWLFKAINNFNIVDILVQTYIILVWVSLLVLKDRFLHHWLICLCPKRDRIRIKRRHGSKIEPNSLSTRGNCPSFIIERTKTICCWVVDYWKELLKKYITKNYWDYEVTEKDSYQTNHCRNIWSPDVTCLEDKWFLYIPIN